MLSKNELLKYVERLQEIMVSVSTGKFSIQEKENEYKELYYKVAADLKRRGSKHRNSFSSLWDFYSYWQSNLPSYQTRREYVRSLYKDLIDVLHLSVENDVSPSAEAEEDEFNLKFSELHEELLVRCKRDFEEGSYDNAVMNAFKLLEIKVRSKASLDDSLYGRDLMATAFSPDKTPFLISNNRGEVQGWMELFRGAIGAFKNPQSHTDVGIKSPSEAFQILAFATYLLNFVDNLEPKEDMTGETAPF